MTANYFLVKPAAGSWRWAAFAFILMLCVMGLSHRAAAADQPSACETCHVGIESMHADIPMACVDCHGGNDKASTKEQAHVQPHNQKLFGSRPFYTWSGLNFESPEFVRFLNPSDLRIADQTCGSCHADQVRNTRKSVMATNAMVHNAVFYNNGAIDSKIAVYGEAFDSHGHPSSLVPNPPPTAEAQARGALLQINPHPQYEITKIRDPLRVAEVNNPTLGVRGPGTDGRIAAVYLNVLKTRLNDPTLWQLGVNHWPGDYRSSGCAACHVLYANTRDESAGDTAKYGHDGFSYSEDKNIPKNQSGWPIKHQFTRAIPAYQCLSCHYHQGNGALDTYIGTIWWDRESDADKVRELKAEPEYGPGQPQLYDHNPEMKHVQFTDYHAHGWNFTKVYKRDDKGELLDAGNNIVNDSDPDKFKKAVHLKDIHFEKGMQCVDCHTTQDMHGDGNVYAQMTDGIEIRCEDCHGSINKRATLVTSGLNGGNSLKDVTTPSGDPWLEDKDGKITQHSKTDPKMSWVVKQVVDSLNPASPEYNAAAAKAKLVLKDGSTGQGTSDAASLAHPSSKIECFTCHSSWQTTCSGCHLPLDLNIKSAELHYEGVKSRAYAPYYEQVIRTDMYFFGIGTYNHGGKVSPFRSATSVVVSAWDRGRNNIIHQQPLVSTPGFTNEGMTPHPPHTVRTTETKTCSDCHLSEKNDNNARIASALGFGVNALNFIGEYEFVAEQGKSVTGVKVTDGYEPQPVIGSSFQKQLDPAAYQAFVAKGRKLGTAYNRRAPNVRSVTVRGEYMLTAEGSSGFKVYDIANINNKAFAQRINQRDNSPLGEGTVVHSPDATFLYTPTSVPIHLGRPQRPENREQPIHPLYRYAFATDRKDGLVLIDINTLEDNNPENNKLHRDVVFNPEGKLSGAMMVKTWGHYAFVVSEQTGLSVVDVDNPTQPRLAGQSAPGDLNGARAVELQLRYAFVLDHTGMKVFDITHPEQPKLVPEATVALADARGLTVSRTYAYVAAGSQGLAIIDVQNPERPKAPIFFNANGALNDAYDVAIGSTNVSYFAYVADGHNGLRVVKLIDTDTPGYLGFAPDPQPELIATYPSGGKAVSVTRGQGRDRYVDESGNQIAVTSRMGSRPFNAAEIQSVLFGTDGSALKVPSGMHKEQGSAGGSGQPAAEKPGGGSR
jgi:hypothetical protein